MNTFIHFSELLLMIRSENDAKYKVDTNINQEQTLTIIRTILILKLFMLKLSSILEIIPSHFSLGDLPTSAGDCPEIHSVPERLYSYQIKLA